MSAKKRVKGKESTYGRRDVARDDDFLSDTLLADLVPSCKLLVHHAWGHGRHTYDEPVLEEILRIVRQYVVNQTGHSPPKDRVKEALRHFAELEIVKRHLRGKDGRERAPFLTHANRYLQIYLPTSRFEFVPTQRYTAHTEKNELAVKATAPFELGKIISGLCGVLVALTNEENEELRGGQDFSIVVNVHTKRFFILLGPARFVNHDCNPNVKMKRDGKSLTFEVIRPIRAGEEILSSYGENYFGENNCECLCESCEKNHTGLYAENDGERSDDEGERRSSTLAPRRSSSEAPVEMPDFEERKTRRGTVFWRAPPIEDDDEEEDDDEDADEEENEEGGEENDREEPILEDAAGNPPALAILPSESTEELDPEEAEPRPSSSREVSASLIDASSIERAAAAPEFALVAPDDTLPVATIALLTPEPTPTHETVSPQDSPPDMSPPSAHLLSVAPSDPALLSPASLTLSDDKLGLQEPAINLLTPPPTSSEGTPPSDTLAPDSLSAGELPIGFAVLDDDDVECPYSPLSSALSSALSDVPSDFDIDEAVHDLFGSPGALREGSPFALPEEVFIRPETPPGDNCAAMKCNMLFTEEDFPVGKWCSRCARHFKIFRVEWPNRIGERRLSPRLPGPPIWSRGRPLLSSPPASRETSVTSGRQKRKAKDSSLDPPQAKKSRLSRVTPVKAERRGYARKPMRRASEDGPESEQGSESTDTDEGKNEEPESEEHDEEAEDPESEGESVAEGEGEAEEEEDDEEDVKPVIGRGEQLSESAVRRRGRLPMPLVKEISPKSTPVKTSQRGRLLHPSPKAAEERQPSLRTSSSTPKDTPPKRSSTSTEERLSARALRAAARHQSLSPSPSRSSSPPVYGLRSRSNALGRSGSPDAKTAAVTGRRSALSTERVSPTKTSMPRSGKRGRKISGAMKVDDDKNTASRRIHAGQSIQSEGDNGSDADSEDRPKKRRHRSDSRRESSPHRSPSPPTLAMYRPLLNGLHISPRGGLFFSPATKPGPPKRADVFKMQVPQPPLWWKTMSPNGIASDLSTPSSSQRPRWAPPPPPRELPPATSPILSPLSPNRGFFSKPSISPPTFTGQTRTPFLPFSSSSSSTLPATRPALGSGPSTMGLGIRRPPISQNIAASLDHLTEPSHIITSKQTIDGKEVIVLDSSEDEIVVTPEKHKAPQRQVTPKTAPRKASRPLSEERLTKSAPAKPGRMFADARLVYEATAAGGVQTRNSSRLSTSRRMTKAAQGKHRND